jgi:putative FmdB family regulatory protein
MPIYEYKCTKGHVFEVMQSFSDDALTKCEVCGAPVQRVYHPVSVHFKGSGFYNTDYGTKRRAREAKENKESSTSSSSSSDGGSTSSDSGGSKSDSSSTSSATESKPASTPAS